MTLSSYLTRNQNATTELLRQPPSRARAREVSKVKLAGGNVAAEVDVSQSGSNLRSVLI